MTKGAETSGTGRNNTGRVTVRWQGGGHKQKYRLIDFKRTRHDEPATVQHIEYDPNRTSFIALIKSIRTAISPISSRRSVSPPWAISMVSGDRGRCEAGGNCMPLAAVPVGTIVHNVEMKPGKGGQIARAAGTYAQYLGRDAGLTALLRLNSGEVRRVRLECKATIGAVSNPDHMNEVISKAGHAMLGAISAHRCAARTAMNPIDHPHGGGEGRTKGGRHPVTPWGQPTKGYKTRKNKRTGKDIVRSRHAKKMQG